MDSVRVTSRGYGAISGALGGNTGSAGVIFAAGLGMIMRSFKAMPAEVQT